MVRPLLVLFGGALFAGWDLDLWLLVHPELRRTARVRAFADRLYERLLPWRTAMEGHELPLAPSVTSS